VSLPEEFIFEGTTRTSLKKNITQQASHSGPHGLKKNVPELKCYSLFAPEGMEK